MGWTELQTRTNTATLAAYGEDATVNGQPVRGLLDRKPADSPSGAGGLAVTLSVLSSLVLSDPRNQAVVAGGQNWTIADYEHDGMGWCVLQLQVAA